MLVKHLCQHYSPKRLLHIGASRGQEAALYDRAGVEKVVWVEALPSVCDQLRTRVRASRKHDVIQALALDEDGIAVLFNVSSNGGESSSVYPIGRHALAFPHVSYCDHVALSSCRLDSVLSARNIPPDCFDAIVMDIQGAELRALKGLGCYLRSVRMAVLEVAPIPLYEGSAVEAEVNEFMVNAGFEVRERLVDPDTNVGDALYIRPPDPGPTTT